MYCFSSGYVGYAWNKVRLGDKWYNIDTTWDDPVTSDGREVLRYDYFLISDEKINKSHIANIANKSPKATDTKYEILGDVSNPFEYNGRLYYGNQNDDLKVYSISLDDLIPKKVSDIRSPYLVIHNDVIYFSNYSNSGYIYSMDLNGNNLQQLNSSHSTSLKLEYPYIKFYNADIQESEQVDIS